MHKKLTLLMFILLCGVLSLSAQGKYEHGENPSQQKAEKEKIIKVYPVPATSQINFQLKHNNNGKNFEIIVYNFLGKVVDKITGFNNRESLSLKDYYSGIYIYQLRNKQGHLVESGKFNVVKQ